MYSFSHVQHCPGMRVVRVIGPVYGTGVRSRNIVGNLLGGIRYTGF
ncbi:YbjQ family protein [Acidithiobacillus thiooxidans]|nr:YbjQ family protein [Acidithiobacillus thiooxidans]